MNMSTELIAIILLGGAIIVLLAWIILLERRLGSMLAGKNGASLEDAINANRSAVDELTRFRASTEIELGNLDTRIKKKIHGVKTLRFNPFAGTGSGGNQSFATSFLNEEGDGVVISSLYSREKVSVFAKPIKARVSEFELTEEEKEVLKN
jgi:hypothetical protein